MPDVVIEKRSAVPYYVQLAQALRSQIGEGRWAPGDALPSEAELCASSGLSRTAVRQALAELVAEGLVHREKGRGTFVRRPPVASLVVQELRGFVDELAGHGVDTVVLRQEAGPVPPAVAADIDVPIGGEVVVLERLRLVDGEPVVAVRTHLPMPRFRSLLDEDLSATSLYTVLAERFDVRPAFARRQITAVAADAPWAGHLGVREGAPLLRVDAVGHDDRSIPFEHFTAFYRGDRTTFEVVASAPLLDLTAAVGAGAAPTHQG